MARNSNSQHLQRLSELTIWEQPIEVRPLPGGITNHNYAVQDGPHAYVARICEERPLLGIDRRNEVVCQRAAHTFGVAPEVVHHEAGILVTRFVPGRTLEPSDVGDPNNLSNIAALLRRLHDSWDRLTGEALYFSAFQAIRTYARTALRFGAALPDDIEDLLEDSRTLARRLGPFIPVLCHNDLLAANIIADGQDVRLVDWEYAGIGHPLFDLAGLSANCALTEAQDIALLTAYHHGAPAANSLREFQVLKAASLLREALWAVIQTVASDLDFDYERYARDNFDAYRAARERIVCVAA